MTGGQYRTTDVDIEGTSDTGGGYNVGWAFAGEWLSYTVNVTTAGTYDIEFRVASGGGGGTFHVAIGGVNRTGSIAVPNTEGWQTWTTVRATGVTLAAGQQVWQLVMATNGATTAVGNFNWIRVVAAGSSPPPPPPPPPPAAPEIVIYGFRRDEREPARQLVQGLGCHCRRQHEGRERGSRRADGLHAVCRAR